MDSVTSQPLSLVADLIEAHAADFCHAVRHRLISADPQAFDYLPSPEDQTHIGLPDALSMLFSDADSAGEISSDTEQFFQKLAIDYRRFGFNSYLPLAQAICEELRVLGADLPFETEFLAEKVVKSVAATMSSELIDAPLAALPAEVVEVERRSRRFFVIRLQASSPLSYQPGQYVPVTTDYLNNSWRYLCPAIPDNQWGHVEFHIQTTDDETLSLLAHARPGDTWLIGTGRGEFGASITESTKDLLFISYGAGLAPLRSILFELSNQTHPPRIHFFVGADYPGELYELMGLWNFASTSPTLSVAPVSKNSADAWWVQATQASKPPRGLHLTQIGRLPEIVSSFGSWADREVLIAGPKAITEVTALALIKRGTPEDQIQCFGF